MKLLSLKTIFLRYLAAVVLMACVGLISNPSGLFIFIPIAIVSLKFLIYDGIVALVRSRLPGFKISPWVLVGYGLTIAWDMLFVYSANQDAPDAGFAFFGTCLLTPWVLVAAIVAMAVATYISRKK
jgi:hypothetical protein